MIARKPQKFSLNSSEITSANLHGEDSSSLSTSQQHKKSAADAATSILEELGVKKTSTETLNKNNLLNVQRQTGQKKVSTAESEEWGNQILNDLKRQKAVTKKTETKKTENKQTQTEKPVTQPKVKSGFHEKFIFFTMLGVIVVATLAFIGGYIKIFDLAIFRQLTSGNVHQLEFVGDFEARQVENGYNRLPLFIVEGTIRNTFFESDTVEKIQLKAFAFDAEKQLISTHFSYAGVVLSDDQLETLSPMNIKALRYSGDLKMLNSSTANEDQSGTLKTGTLKDQGVPFQVVFFKAVPTIKRTSLQIVSYVRNNKLVYVRAPDLQ